MPWYESPIALVLAGALAGPVIHLVLGALQRKQKRVELIDQWLIKERVESLELIREHAGRVAKCVHNLNHIALESSINKVDPHDQPSIALRTSAIAELEKAQEALYEIAQCRLLRVGPEVQRWLSEAPSVINVLRERTGEFTVGDLDSWRRVSAVMLVLQTRLNDAISKSLRPEALGHIEVLSPISQDESGDIGENYASEAWNYSDHQLDSVR